MTLRTSSFYVLVLVAIMPLVWLNAAVSPDQQDPRDVVLATTSVVGSATSLSSSPPGFSESADVCRPTGPLLTPVLQETKLFPGDPSVVGCGPTCPRNCCWFGICMCH